MPRELRPLVRALSLRPTELAGRRAWHGPGVVAATLGVGPRAARRSTGLLLEASGASGVLVIGVAGACDPDLRVADVVNPVRVVDAADGTTFEPDAFLTGTAGAREGTLVTVARIGDPVPAGSWAVDMETAAVAAECAARGVPWDVRRAVSDVPGGLPASTADLLRADGRVDVGGLVRLLVREPAKVGALVRLGRDTGRAVTAVTAAAAAALGAHR
jgi:nucleoside phosphorylase